jgi:hypothetical protein
MTVLPASWNVNPDRLGTVLATPQVWLATEEEIK